MATGRVPTTANSPLTAKGDLFGYSTTQARVPVGSDGETLVADSSATTGLRWQGNFAAGKNKIINGAFDIWQRGTSFSLTGPTQTFGADRFQATGNATYSRQSFTAGTAPVSGYEGQYFARWDITSNSANYDFGTPLENVRTFAGETVTLSFWAKASATTSNAFFPRLQQNFGTGGSPSSVVYTDGSNISLTTSWTRYSVTLSLPSIAGKTIGTNNNSFLKPMVQLVTTSAVTIDFWGWQLESGNTATAFQTATGTLAGELAACQRYYWRTTANNLYSPFGQGNANTTTGAYILINHPVEMRTVASSVDYSTLAIGKFGNAVYAVSSVSLADRTKTLTLLSVGMANTGYGANDYCQLSANNSTSAYVALNAEL